MTTNSENEYVLTDVQKDKTNSLIKTVLLVSAGLIIIALVIQISKPVDPASKNPALTYDILINCLFSIAFSLIASVIVVFSSSKILGEPLGTFIAETKEYISDFSRLNQTAISTGLIEAFPRRSEHQEIFFDLLKRSWMNLDIMGIKIEFLGRDPRFTDFIHN